MYLQPLSVCVCGDAPSSVAHRLVVSNARPSTFNPLSTSQLQFSTRHALQRSSTPTIPFRCDESRENKESPATTTHVHDPLPPLITRVYSSLDKTHPIKSKLPLQIHINKQTITKLFYSTRQYIYNTNLSCYELVCVRVCVIIIIPQLLNNNK